MAKKKKRTVVLQNGVYNIDSVHLGGGGGGGGSDTWADTTLYTQCMQYFSLTVPGNMSTIHVPVHCEWILT